MEYEHQEAIPDMVRSQHHIPKKSSSNRTPKKGDRTDDQTKSDYRSRHSGSSVEGHPEKIAKLDSKQIVYHQRVPNPEIEADENRPQMNHNEILKPQIHSSVMQHLVNDDRNHDNMSMNIANLAASVVLPPNSSHSSHSSHHTSHGQPHFQNHSSHHSSHSNHPSHNTINALKNEKKTKGRVRIRMEFISNKLRRYTTFSKRKTGIMKKAYELSTLTGTQVMLLVASETGHVYTFATPKLQPMITSETGKALIQTCLNSPDPPPPSRNPDQRMSQTGYEETELAYPISTEEDAAKAAAAVGDNSRHLYTSPDSMGSPNHSFGGLTMPHPSFPMSMGFPMQGGGSPTSKQGESSSTMGGPQYTVQQQLGSFGSLFPPPTTYASNMPPMPQTTGHTNNNNMQQHMQHMVRLPNSSMMAPHSIDIANMVALHRSNPSSTASENGSEIYTYNTSRGEREESQQDTKSGIKHDSDEGRNDSSNSL